jgi:protein SCO1/2
MSAKAKTFVTVSIFFITTIILAACTPKVQLPILYEAPGFTLTNQDGLEIRLSDFQDKVAVINFFYTRCPDVCGELHYKLRSIWEQLKPGLKQDLVLISVSFDSYDTSEVLKQYDKFYDVPGWQFLTGTEEQIRQVANDYGVSYPVEIGGWQFLHNIAIVLTDRNGMVRKTYGDPYFPENDMIRELTYLLNQ